MSGNDVEFCALNYEFSYRQGLIGFWLGEQDGWSCHGGESSSGYSRGALNVLRRQIDPSEHVAASITDPDADPSRSGSQVLNDRLRGCTSSKGSSGIFATDKKSLSSVLSCPSRKSPPNGVKRLCASIRPRPINPPAASSHRHPEQPLGRCVPSITS